MLNRVILWSLQNRLVMLALAFLLFVFGVRSTMQVPLDVFPDFAPPQVVIQSEAPGLSAEEVEQLRRQNRGVGDASPESRSGRG